MFKSPLSTISGKVKCLLKGAKEITNDNDNSDDIKDQVNFTINGNTYKVKQTDENFGPESRLVDFIRDGARLKGTKWTCREGGCGACVVTVRTKDVQSGELVVRAVNSCLAPVWGCEGWDISTVEDLGNSFDGYHPIQKQLVNAGGSQCGFCSAGMVMNMYSLANSKTTQLTPQDIEDNFDGNICRCTGYRPIMDAFKTFATVELDSCEKLCSDIEDLSCQNNCGLMSRPFRSNVEKNVGLTKGASSNTFGCCSGTNGSEANLCHVGFPLTLQDSTGVKWVKVVDLKGVFDNLKNFTKNNLKYRIVAGNTGTGVFKTDGPYDAYLEVNSVPELTQQSMTTREAVLGAGTTLTKTIEFFENLSNRDGFGYAGGMAKHLKRVANTPVRNLGTIAGNLMLKHAHKEFPSDVLMLLETIGAKIVVGSSPTATKSFSPWDFLQVDIRGQLILQVILPIRDVDHVFRSYKITKRFQNAHAYVNAGFLFKVDQNQNFKILERPTITFGGIRPEFLRAFKTEEVLNGVELKNLNSLKNALKVLESEVEPDEHLPDACPEYRKALTLSLLYKTVLGLLGEKGVTSNVRSGGIDLQRKLHSGQQFFDKDQDKDSPLYKPVHKIEGLYQVSGEAEYINDIPRQDGELFGTFVLAEVAPANLKNVDASDALKISGVVKFLMAKDIPGRNSFFDGYRVPVQEVLFVEKQILASGQAIGLILAETQQIANLAASKVKVEYEGEKQKPLLTIKDGVNKARKEGTLDKLYYPIQYKSPQEPSKTSKHKIKGEFQIGSQAHFHMETHVTLCLKREDGLTIYTAGQNLGLTQNCISNLLNLPHNKINIEVRRLGGAFGGKITRSVQIAAAASLATFVTKRPVRLVLDFEKNLEMMGKRLPYYNEYEVGFNDDGKIDALETKVFCDPGMVDGAGTSVSAARIMQNCYAATGWIVQPARVLTDTHANTYARAPGTPQGIAIIENIMEHIADNLGKDPIEVRKANFLQTGDPLLPVTNNPKFQGTNLVPSLIDEIKKIGDYDARKKQLEEFNKNNRWTKRGLALVPMRYPQDYPGRRLPCFVAIHPQDGTVSVSHGGIEMGQGINTKVAQVVGHVLKVPMTNIVIKPTNNLVSQNSDGTGGAITSELVCYATLRACLMLIERMEPIKKASPVPLSWEQLVTKSHAAGIDLRATYLYSKNDTGVSGYDIYGCNLTEIELDVLTGEYKIVRLDLIEDAGKSLSPEVDIGQIEGCVVMGLGLWTTEKLVFHPDTGRLLTRNTWEYKVPLPKDIPEDFRITIMRNAPNPLGVLGSKATGEPPLCMSVAVLFAIKAAIKAARKDAGNNDWFQLDGPVTPEDVVRLSLVDPQSQFVI